MTSNNTQTDVITIMTPESVPITLVLAGLGSRFIGLLIDSLIITIIFVLVTFGGAGVASGIQDETALLILAALYVIFSFLLIFGYYVLFEVKNNGQTPGKKAASIRVIREDGQPVNFTAASIRAIVFVLLDFMFLGIPGMISILVSKKNQRIGDIAAGTLVVRSHATKSSATLPPPAPPPAALSAGLESWDVSQIDDAQLSIIQDFLQRRIKLDVSARKQLATELVGQVSDQIHAPTASDDPERLLEQIYAAKNLSR